MMVFFPDTSVIDLRNPVDVTRDFPREQTPDAKILFADEFRSGFFESLEKQADYIHLAQVPDSVPSASDSQSISFTKPKRFDVPTFTYRVPKREYLEAHGLTADLGLFVCHLKSVVGEVEVLNPRIGAIRETFLVLEGWYIIWDYAKDKPIAYGRFRPIINFKRDLETKDWMQAFHKAGRQVVEKSPFKGSKWLKLAE